MTSRLLIIVDVGDEEYPDAASRLSPLNVAHDVMGDHPEIDGLTLVTAFWVRSGTNLVVDTPGVTGVTGEPPEPPEPSEPTPERHAEMAEAIARAEVQDEQDRTDERERHVRRIAAETLAGMYQGTLRYKSAFVSIAENAIRRTLLELEDRTPDPDDLDNPRSSLQRWIETGE